MSSSCYIPSTESSVKKMWLKLLNTINDRKVSSVIQITNDVAAAAFELSEKKSVMGLARFVARVVNSLKDNLEIDEYMYFQSSEGEWKEIFTPDFFDIVNKATSKMPVQVLNTTSVGTYVNIVSVGEDMTVGWLKDVDRTAPPKMYAKTKNYNATLKIVSDLIWRQFNEKPILVEESNGLKEESKSPIVFSPDDSWVCKTSAATQEYEKYLNKFICADVSRSILFYGPPGTGKSTMTQTIVKDLGLRSIRIVITSGITARTLYNIINVFKPDCVIIDDVDRMCDFSMMYDVLQTFKKTVKLVMATANKRSGLDEALLRPGRFDELVPVTKLDDEAILSILGREHTGMLEKVRDWPVAYIEEYKTRRKFMSEEEAEKTVVDLQKRVDRLKKYYDEIEEDNVSPSVTEQSPVAIDEQGWIKCE